MSIDVSQYVIHQDALLLVLNKPSNVSLLRDRSGEPNFWDAIKAAYPHAKLVHRLDKGTSGVLLVALARSSQQKLNRLFVDGGIRKQYVAVTAGHFPGRRTLEINLPLKKGRKARYRVAGLREEIRGHARGWNITEDDGHPGHRSTTYARSVAHGPRRSLVAIRPLTGRTHQIRVHLSWVGYPIVGDHLYGAPESKEQAWSRLALHCHRMSIPGMHSYSAGVPNDLIEAIAK